MDIFILGAGKPYKGKTPSALKKIFFQNNVLEWHIKTFKKLSAKVNINFLGGYNIELIIKKFPKLNFTKIYNWKYNNILDSFLQSPFSEKPAFCFYVDTIFNFQTIKTMSSMKSYDMVISIDTLWKSRYPNRSKNDLITAEKINIKTFNKKVEAEFTGLIYFSSKTIDFIKKNKHKIKGKNLLDLISFMESCNLNIKYHNIKGKWAEFNSSEDIARFVLGTKAETLENISQFQENFNLPRQLYFNVNDWRTSETNILTKIKKNFHKSKIIVRSSSKSEDTWNLSNAGVFQSFANINTYNKTKIKRAINSCIDKYKKQKNNGDQVLIQEYITDAKISGVIFTCSLDTGANYYKINFDEKSNRTDVVTSGRSNDLKTIIIFKELSKNIEFKNPFLSNLIKAIRNIEKILNYEKLDIEFSITNKNKIYILQIRPITADHSDYEFDNNIIKRILLNNIKSYSLKTNNSLPYKRFNIFSNMSDWNPAEIIGTRPKPLALSLYKYLITNEIWARQRYLFGYQDLRSQPLLYTFAGQPYIDVNLSLNSFIPRELKLNLKKKILDSYLKILNNNPHLHDKIEFDVALTIWTPDFFSKAKSRFKYTNISDSEILKLETALKRLTCKSLKRLTKDIKKIKILESKRNNLVKKNSSSLNNIIKVIKDCKKYGSLSFAHAARAGFIAINILDSFVELGYFSQNRKIKFLNSIKTVNGELIEDKIKYKNNIIKTNELITKYGHLRPGTYEINNKAYWEDPEMYFDAGKIRTKKNYSIFYFNKNEKMRFKIFLDQIGSDLEVKDFISYLSTSIISREKIKFEFTKNLSLFFDLLLKNHKFSKFSRNQLSYLKLIDLINLKLKRISIIDIKNRIQKRFDLYNFFRVIELPFLIRKDSDFYNFEKYNSQPNFITQKKTQGTLALLELNKKMSLKNKIVLISQADPGYDWIFSLEIIGLITQYGGSNSHMAIRAAEMNLPSAIGVGDKLFEDLCNGNKVFLDCENKVINIL